MTQFTKNTLLDQLNDLRAKRDKIRSKIEEHLDYLNGNSRNAFLVNYFDGCEGGYEFGHAYDFIYEGSIVSTKYGSICKVKGWDVLKNLIYFEHGEPLDPSRISQVGLTEKDYVESQLGH